MAPKDYLGKDQRNVANDKEKKVDDIKVLDAGDILLLKTYGQGPYAKPIKAVEDDIQKTIKRVNELTGIKEFSRCRCFSGSMLLRFGFPTCPQTDPMPTGTPSRTSCLDQF